MSEDQPKKPKVFIGTSGWNYKHWKGTFYPENSSPGDWFNLYQSVFNTVEINNTFYHLPSGETVDSWYENSREDFLFSVKASRYITHMKKLKDPRASTKSFFAVINRLGEKAGPILFQLPPKWNRNADRLGHFIESIPEDYKYTFEFRDTSWFHREIYSILNRLGSAFCIFQLEGVESPKKITSDFIYIRLHGPDGAYRGKYGKRELSGWAGAISSWTRAGKTVYCYFDNDEHGYAPQNASDLADMLGEI